MINPQPIVIEGHGVRLEPLLRSHSDELHAAAADGELWKLWYVSIVDLEPSGGSVYVDAALEAQRVGTAVPWVVRELRSGKIIGSTRFHDIVREIGRVEIGYTFYGASWQRTFVNTACKLLLMEHAFEALGCAVVGFRVDNLNLKSQQSIEAVGAKRDGVLRRFQARRDGSARDSFFYSILVEEWPDIKRRLEERLRKHAS